MTRRYPLQPLLDAAGGISMAKLRETIPMNGRQYRNATELGLLFDQADRWAVRLGFHPYEVWPEMLEDALADQTRVCEERGCDVTFVLHPQGQHRRFCSDSCRRRAGERRARELGLPSWQRKREGRRRYYEQHGDYERARQRRYDRARRAA